jgi:hypothetical protein
LDNRYICNTRGEHVASFYPVNLEIFYQLEQGTQKLDEELLGGFKHMEKDLFCIWYKPSKSFKQKLVDKYPTTSIRKPY